MRQIIVFLAIFLVTACGRESDMQQAPAEANALFAVWVEESTGAVLDLTAGKFGVVNTMLYLPYNIKCEIALSIVGDSKAAVIKVLNNRVTPYDVKKQDSCRAFTQNYTASVSGNQLTVTGDKTGTSVYSRK